MNKLIDSKSIARPWVARWRSAVWRKAGSGPKSGRTATIEGTKTLAIFNAAIARMAPFAGLAAAALLASPAAQAVELSGKWYSTPADYTNGVAADSFSFDTSAAYEFITPGFGYNIDVIPVTYDALGAYGLSVYPAFRDGIVEIGYLYDYFSPALYDDSSNVELYPGVYTGSGGATLTLTAVPEPAVWAVMFTGLGLVGGAMRLARRRQAVAA